MPLRPVQPPVRGVSNAMPFAKTPGDMCPPASLRNVRNFAAGTDRAQFGSRPGMSRLIDQQIGNGAPVQALWPVSRPSRVTGYVLGPCTLIDSGTSSQADALNGNLWLLDGAPGMTRAHFLDPSAENGPSTNTVQVVAWHPSGDRYAAISVYTDTVTGRDESYVRCYRATDGALLWSKLLDYTAFDDVVVSGTRATSAAFSQEFLFVAARAKVIALRYNDGFSPNADASPAVFDCAGWASETIAVAVYDDGAGTYTPSNTRETVYVAFMGSLNGGPVTNTTQTFSVEAGVPASHWRAGVMKFTVRSQAVVTLGSTVLSQSAWGQTSSGGVANNASSAFYESFHGYFRISERTESAPHGCRITSMAVDASGNVIIGRTNQGYGPNAASYPAGGTGSGLLIPNTTVCKISAAGVMQWEADTVSLIELGHGGGWNDIPTTATDDPSIKAVAVDALGDVYCGGRRNGPGYSAFKLSGEDGRGLWAIGLMPSGGPPYEVIRSIAIDPTDGNPVFAGNQNNSYEDASSLYAHLFKRDAASGDEIWSYPNTSTSAGLGVDADAYGVAVSVSGQVIYGTTKVAGSPGSGGAWTYQDGYWIQAAAVRTVLLAPVLMQQPMAVVLQAGNVAARPFVTLFASGDGRTAIRVGIKDNTDAAIQKVEFGGSATSLTNGSADEPASVAAEAAHGIATGTPFRLEVRVLNNTISLRLNGSATDLLRHELTDAEVEQFGILRHFGFESSVANARVLRAERCPLESVTENRSELLFAVAGGDVWVVTDDGENVPTGRLLASGVFNTSGPVSLTDFEQVVRGVDGTHVKDINAGTLVISDVGGTTATTAFPGASETTPASGVYIPGTTRMTIVANFLARVGTAGDAQDPQNAWFCAIGDTDDYNTGAVDEPGRAFASNNNTTGRIGEPIRAMTQATNGVMVFGCTNSMWRLVGDPALGNPEISPIMLGAGVSGKDAMELASDGILLVHSPDGAFAIAALGDGPTPLSQSVLTEGIQFPRKSAGDYLVQVRRDTRKHLAFFFITPVESGPATHFVYDERVGSFSPAAGGFFVDEYADRIGPTASINWRGQIVLGTRDGYLLVFDDDATDDDGEAFTVKWPVTLLDEPDLSMDTILSRIVILPTEASAPITYKVFGAPTPERVYDEDTRTLLMTGTVPADGKPIVRKVRDPVMMLELSATSTAGAIGIEAVEVETRPGGFLSRRRRGVAELPEASPAPVADPEETPVEGGEGPTALSGAFSMIGDNFSTEGEDFPLSTGRWSFAGPTSTAPGSETDYLTAIVSGSEDDIPTPGGGVSGK